MVATVFHKFCELQLVRKRAGFVFELILASKARSLLNENNENKLGLSRAKLSLRRA